MNKAILIGRLTRDPDLNFAANTGKGVCKFNIAVARPFKKGESDFINCIAFGKPGETIAQYMTKGSEIAITGNIRTGSYDAKDGTKRYTTDVIVETFEFIGNKKTQQTQQVGEQTNEWNPEPIDDGDMPF